jgi:hypothetical protein
VRTPSQTMQLIGVVTALITGVLAMWATYRKPDRTQMRDGRTSR